MANQEKPALTEERKQFYEKIDKEHLAPLWTVLSDLVTPEPTSACVPHLWHYEPLRRYLLESGGLITAKEAERRVLVLENPGMRGTSKITTSLYAGLQLVLPGEIAPAHRHTQSALRFVLEGANAHTTVDGEKTNMNFGDFVITPPMAWHDHGNQSEDPMVWLDGLDIPMVSFYDASFAEAFEQDAQPLSKGVGDSPARYGANMLPVDFAAKGLASPIFNYPYERSRESLDVMKRQEEWDPCHGLKLRYINPVDGGFAMPTIGTYLQLLPKGFSTAPYRSTDATVYVVTEGAGKTTVDGQEFNWGPKDIFVVPSWKWSTHVVSEEAVLFSFSDRAAQQKLGFWREDRQNN
ncbi:gentisate 1,2-dioxygenase [Sneathiella marina]|uniref:Gentisate 1,2-dioxygenase n=1 Tax=Sneathiella marina TaxID=2950108 RepID=A0ABY4W7W3_9PROT|nr:gentisate 1,2-dioxygenase [Sneathiella marina]USG62213.1 gentisate 1,2-dioxygenase [Sneathiella marina]